MSQIHGLFGFFLLSGFLGIKGAEYREESSDDSYDSLVPETIEDHYSKASKMLLVRMQEKLALSYNPRINVNDEIIDFLSKDYCPSKESSNSMRRVESPPDSAESSEERSLADGDQSRLANRLQRDVTRKRTSGYRRGRMELGNVDLIGMSSIDLTGMVVNPVNIFRIEIMLVFDIGPVLMVPATPAADVISNPNAEFITQVMAELYIRQLPFQSDATISVRRVRVHSLTGSSVVIPSCVTGIDKFTKERLAEDIAEEINNLNYGDFLNKIIRSSLLEPRIMDAFLGNRNFLPRRQFNEDNLEHSLGPFFPLG